MMGEKEYSKIIARYSLYAGSVGRTRTELFAGTRSETFVPNFMPNRSEHYYINCARAKKRAPRDRNPKGLENRLHAVTSFLMIW